MAVIPENHDPADDDRDPQLTLLYREGGRELPPPRLDAAIRAAARRAAGSRPPLASSLLRTWRLPVAIAAVVVLSVGMVTLMVEEGKERVKPGNAEESVAKQALPSSAQSLPREDKTAVPGTIGTRPESAETGGGPTGSPRLAIFIREYENQPPEKWLEKIVQLRRQGDSTEAAAMLSEFKRRFPMYPLPPALR